jgi:hypothetical protein
MRTFRRLAFILCSLLIVALGVQAQRTPQQDFLGLYQGDLVAWDAGETDFQPLTTWGYNGGPILSPDGTQIAYLSMPTAVVETGPAGEYLISTPQNMWIMDTGSRAFQRVAGRDDNTTVMRGVPVWSPDSTRLLWTEFTLSSNASAGRVMVYDRLTDQVSEIISDLPLGFQDAGIFLPTFRWSPAGASRLLFTYNNVGDGLSILEIYRPDQPQAAPASLVLGDVDDPDSLAIGHVWVDAGGGDWRVAVLTVGGTWSLIDPARLNRTPLTTPPSLVLADNPSALALQPNLIPLASGWEIQWQALRPDGSVAAGIRTTSLSPDGVPAIAPDGESFAWYDSLTNPDLTLYWQRADGSAPQVVAVDDARTGFSFPVNVTGGPTRWILTGNLDSSTAACSPTPRLRAPGSAFVLPGEPNVIRSAPGTGDDSQVIGSIPAGDGMIVLGEPVCTPDGRYWYEVDYNGIIGWTAEGEGAVYWLAPANG